MTIWLLPLSSTANRLRAMNTAEVPWPRLGSCISHLLTLSATQKVPFLSWVTPPDTLRKHCNNGGSASECKADWSRDVKKSGNLLLPDEILQKASQHLKRTLVFSVRNAPSAFVVALTLSCVSNIFAVSARCDRCVKLAVQVTAEGLLQKGGWGKGAGLRLYSLETLRLCCPSELHTARMRRCRRHCQAGLRSQQGCRTAIWEQLWLQQHQQPQHNCLRLLL